MDDFVALHPDIVEHVIVEVQKTAKTFPAAGLNRTLAEAGRQVEEGVACAGGGGAEG